MMSGASDDRSQRLTLPSAHSVSHSSYSNASRRRFGATGHCFQVVIQPSPVSGWCDVGPFAVGVSLVARRLRTMTAAVMEFIPQNVTKIAD